MEIKRLKESDLAVNEPVEWNIYDAKGRFLVRKGMLLRSTRQIHKILQLKSFIKVDADALTEIDGEIHINNAMSPFHHIDVMLEKLSRVYRHIIYRPAAPEKNIPEKLRNISKRIISLCEYDLDATIGSIHLGKSYDYTILHPLHCAIIAYNLATKVGITDHRLNSIICAALTANLGMFELQKKLVDQPGPLNTQQLADVKKHTMRSSILLKRIGTFDKLWLEIVLQHHEKQDGSGYPRGLSGDEFIPEARIVGIADRYTAMMAPRLYRDGFSPAEALRRIFEDCGKEVDEELSGILIKDMGVFPPGSYVQLANNEIAIVARRSENTMQPIVKSIVAADGHYFHKPFARLTIEDKYRIVGLTKPPGSYQHNLLQIWDYNLT